MVSILVGGKMQSEIPIKLSEVWHLEDTGKDRKITIRSSRLRKPMKSRMFIASGDSDFTWKFNPESWVGEGIADWYSKWEDNDGKRLTCHDTQLYIVCLRILTTRYRGWTSS